VPEALTVLLDQNVPRAIAQWLRSRRPQWTIYHTSDAALSGRPDEELFAWAQQRQALIVTFDEDFADQRTFPLGVHAGIIRLRVWPTTIEETQRALERLLGEVPDAELARALVIIDREAIRVRRGQ
jgi:predicted nuclease of predicted toxin-antitoxin system